jgi:glycosyltransferase involved in cell wall biosynthesis
MQDQSVDLTLRSGPGGISVAIPAYNEEKYLPATLASLIRAGEFFAAKEGRSIEILVVDNDSTDQTAHIASALGAHVIQEAEHNIAKVRNTGAKAVSGEVIVFVDADTLVPESFVWRIHQVMADPASLGGAVDTDYRPAHFHLEAYLWLWRLLGRATGMAQGAAQFYRREDFFTLGGFDERLFMGEDVELFWRLKKLAKRTNGRVMVIDDIQVVPSCRRYDQWPFWRTLVWTNPLLAALYKRRQTVWRGWHKDPPR